MVTELTFEKIIEDIRAVDEELMAYEKKYGLATPVFYELFCQGLLDDGEYEQTEDFCMWAGAYEIKLEREERFLELSRQRAAALKVHAAGRTLELLPRAEMAHA